MSTLEVDGDGKNNFDNRLFRSCTVPTSVENLTTKTKKETRFDSYFYLIIEARHQWRLQCRQNFLKSERMNQS